MSKFDEDRIIQLKSSLLKDNRRGLLLADNNGDFKEYNVGNTYWDE